MHCLVDFLVSLVAWLVFMFIAVVVNLQWSLQYE